jgi:protein-tyrosine phosphatase
MHPARQDGFADIHSHVLYGMDDGARTRDDSLRMLELAARSGTTDIVATPHANSRYRYDPHLIDAQIADLNASVAGIGVHRGCDFSLQADNIDDAIAHPARYAINGRQYLMVEFPDIPTFGSHDGILEHLLGAGLVPVITHPERNAAIRRTPRTVARWVDLGCFVQVTAGSFGGRFGKGARDCAIGLLASGLVHFVASDAHDCEHRPPTLGSVYDALVREWGAESIRPLFIDNPRAVIAGATIDAPSLPLRRRRRWFEVWK